MARGQQADPAQAAGACPAPLPGQVQGRGRDRDVGDLGQSIATRLFSAGLDLNSVLMLTGDGPARQRLRQVVEELDEAIKELRHLMLAVAGPAVGAALDGGSPDHATGQARRTSVPGPTARPR